MAALVLVITAAREPKPEIKRALPAVKLKVTCATCLFLENRADTQPKSVHFYTSASAKPQCVRAAPALCGHAHRAEVHLNAAPAPHGSRSARSRSREESGTPRPGLGGRPRLPGFPAAPGPAALTAPPAHRRLRAPGPSRPGGHRSRGRGRPPQGPGAAPAAGSGCAPEPPTGSGAGAGCRWGRRG